MTKKQTVNNTFQLGFVGGELLVKSGASGSDPYAAAAAAAAK